MRKQFRRMETCAVAVCEWSEAESLAWACSALDFGAGRCHLLFGLDSSEAMAFASLAECMGFAEELPASGALDFAAFRPRRSCSGSDAPSAGALLRMAKSRYPLASYALCEADPAQWNFAARWAACKERWLLGLAAAGGGESGKSGFL